VILLVVRFGGVDGTNDVDGQATLLSLAVLHRGRRLPLGVSSGCGQQKSGEWNEVERFGLQKHVGTFESGECWPGTLLR